MVQFKLIKSSTRVCQVRHHLQGHEMSFVTLISLKMMTNLTNSSAGFNQFKLNHYVSLMSYLFTE